MASRPYSTRFLAVLAPGLWHEYTIPAGYRAVVKSIGIAQTGSTVGTCWVQVSGVTVFGAALSASPSAHNEYLAQVGYAGEIIRGFVSAANIELFVSGFLLVDNGAMDDGHDDITVERVVETELMPAGPRRRRLEH